MPVYPTYQQGNTLNGIATVTGINGARNALTPSGSTLLMDANEPVFYIRTTGYDGTTTVDAYRFEKIEPEQSVANLTKSDIKSLIKEVLNESLAEQQSTAQLDRISNTDNSSSSTTASA